MEKYIVTSRYRDTNTKCKRAFVADKSQISKGDVVVIVDKTIFAKNVDNGSGWYTCQSEFGKIGIQYYNNGMGLSLLVGDGHSKFDKNRISNDDE